MEAELEAARWRLGLIVAEELPALAIDLLCAGYDSTSLGQLAALGYAPIHGATATGLWLAALDELGTTLPTRSNATLALAREVSRQIIDQEIEPLHGARQILLIGAEDLEPSDSLERFRYPVEHAEHYILQPDLSRRDRERGLKRHRRTIVGLAKKLLQNA